jgi:hypothetical protein
MHTLGSGELKIFRPPPPKKDEPKPKQEKPKPEPKPEKEPEKRLSRLEQLRLEREKK